MSDDRYRPGCYGSPLCSGANIQICSICPLSVACKVDADARGMRLRDVFGVTPMLTRARHGALIHVGRLPKAGAATVKEAPAVISNKKAGATLARFKERGIDLVRDTLERRNTFLQEPPAFMRVTMEHLFEGGFNRTELRERFERELQWSSNSASSHVGIATGVLIAAGAVVQRAQRFVPVDMG